MNPIIIIGGDHHNTLAMIRCFGEKHCTIRKIIIHENTQKKPKIRFSKYVRKNFVVFPENEELILDCLLESIPENEEKAVLLPCSDFAEYLIDSNYNKLCNHYILPGFTNKPGNVCFLMDKLNQYKFAVNNNIPMAKTWTLDLTKNLSSLLTTIDFPCIVKPRVSAQGHKDDIRICLTKNDLNCTLECFLSQGYSNVLVQQFLHKKYEVCAFGCLLSNHPMNGDKPMIVGGSVLKTREFPPKGGGSLTFATFISDKKIDELLLRILSLLHSSCYNGMYDIEFLVCDDNIYLNEINFRHSGNGYGLINNGLFAPYIWYLDAIGLKYNEQDVFRICEGFIMDELSDLHHRKANNIKMSEWIKDVKRTSAFSIYSPHDKRGSFGYYLSSIFRFIKRRH